MLPLLSLTVWVGFFYGVYAFVKNKRSKNKSTNERSFEFVSSPYEGEYDYDYDKYKHTEKPAENRLMQKYMSGEPSEEMVSVEIVNVSKIAFASILVCALTLYDGYLYWFASLFFDMDLDELISHKVNAKHAIEASLFAYAVVFPATVIMISRVFNIKKRGIKYILASSITLSLLRTLFIVVGILRTSNPVGYVVSPIVLTAACYLLLRFYANTIPAGVPNASQL